MDKVVIEGLEVQAQVGVPDEERNRPQRIVLDLELKLDLKNAGLRDNVSETVDYAKVSQEVQQFIQGRSFRLVEAIAEGVAEQILKNPKIKEVEIRVRKFSVPGAGSVGVEVERSRVTKAEPAKPNQPFSR